jgi:hypothetical protein
VFGITGFTVGFALKEIMCVQSSLSTWRVLVSRFPLRSTNTFAGILLVLTRPFKTGWHIKVHDFHGKVIGIDYRYVHLLQRDRTEVLLPAYTVFSSPIVVEKREE